ncbi:hypothetical protein IQ17_00630 [Bradyrhizobium daqingense]|uniref:Uncharacterized protein n=1 Tax=Bradyrhizobium daqingense TaxID=993502 RepID=A0A562LV03_9BRAD|nr:hypothetical protein IQ17_00630 [Bradyrhizobium daqingense]
MKPSRSRGGSPCIRADRIASLSTSRSTTHQLGRKVGQPVEPTLCETIVDDNILAFNPPALAQPLPERVE